ncbi:hypothetical protein TRAPUB_8417 [Trametes pubescens]|uniref:F-box domain-containing protein n=1 Tax=Trametes pubescens TaxID=154538 RepID=A0A1M2W523_TRAPU|nr:hypothetical protein TRAPUB_8417 [Trametes pubescens]
MESPLSTSAHRALQIDEVLTSVFRHLSPYIWERQVLLASPDGLHIDYGKDFSHLAADALPRADNQQALVRCSLVSRTFCPHALKVLWRTLPNLRPVQHLLNSMQFSYADLESGTPYHTFPAHIDTSSLTARKWRRYHWYASCIVGVRAVIDYNALEEWSDRGGPPLLPKLQSARFRLDPRSINRALRLLVTSVRDLTINLDSSGVHWEGSPLSTADILRAAARRAPATEVLNVTFKAPPKDLLPILPLFKHLRALVITGWMTPSFHEAIEVLEHLELLYVKLYWTHHADASLRDLQLRRCSSIKAFVALTLSEPILCALRMTEFPVLERVRLEVWPHASDATEALTQIMDTLHKHAPKLRSFVLTTRSAAKHGDRPPPRLATVLDPLLEHAALETLSVTLEDNYAFALTRADILAFAVAWPNIVTLHLAHAPARSPDALPPLVTVLDFVAACPRLETLVLCARFDCTSRDTWRDAAIPPHSLRGLFLGLNAETGSYRPDKTWRALAAVLDRCFPHLDVGRNLVRAAVVEAQTMELWQGVLQHLQDIRAGGRRSLSPEL